jgi:hypothetical protein
MCHIRAPFCRICRIVQTNGQVSIKRIYLPVASNYTTKYFSLQISLRSDESLRDRDTPGGLIHHGEN